MRIIFLISLAIILCGCVLGGQNNSAENYADNVDSAISTCARAASERYMYHLDGQIFSNAVIGYCSETANAAAMSSAVLTGQPKWMWDNFFSQLVAKRASEYVNQNLEKIRTAKNQIALSKHCVAMVASNKENMLKKVSKAYPNASNSEKIGMIVTACISYSKLNQTLDFQGVNSDYFGDLYSALYDEAKNNIMNFPQ